MVFMMMMLTMMMLMMMFLKDHFFELFFNQWLNNQFFNLFEHWLHNYFFDLLFGHWHNYFFDLLFDHWLNHSFDLFFDHWLKKYFHFLDMMLLVMMFLVMMLPTAAMSPHANHLLIQKLIALYSLRWQTNWTSFLRKSHNFLSRELRKTARLRRTVNDEARINVCPKQSDIRPIRLDRLRESCPTVRYR